VAVAQAQPLPTSRALKLSTASRFDCLALWLTPFCLFFLTSNRFSTSSCLILFFFFSLLPHLRPLLT
jgi:hypothetical protein